MQNSNSPDCIKSRRHRQCFRLDMIAAALSCSFNQAATANESFRWRPTSMISAVPSTHFSICKCTNNDKLPPTSFVCNRNYSTRHLQRTSFCFPRYTNSYSPTVRDRHIGNQPLFAKQRDDDTSNNPNRIKNKKRQSRKRPISTFSTAVCIVPPDDAWDSIQRARHLARDSSFYKWPPAIRLFHPFAPKSEIPSHVGKLAEWIDDEGIKFELSPDSEDLFPFSTPFEVTLDSLQILPHWEVLDAQKDVLESQIPQQTLGETLEEKRFRKQKEKSQVLIDEEVKKGIKRKKERVVKQLISNRRKLKRELKQFTREAEMGNKNAQDEVVNIMNRLKENEGEIERVSSLESIEEDGDDKESVEATEEAKSNSYQGPCVIYLSPNEQSCIALKELREKLRSEMFSDYDAFSPSSSVTPYPEFLPKKALSKREAWRPLLPIARFASVEAAVKVAKMLQKTWHPLEFNVTDIQFISRNDDDYAELSNVNFASGTGFGRLARDSPVRKSISISTSGEVDDVSKHGVFGCDAMVMLLGEEPEEEDIEDDATLSMIVPGEENEADDFDDVNAAPLAGKGSSIDYNTLFTTAEREYQRMASHEELSSAVFLGEVPIFSGDDDLEKWLDTDEDESADEGATAVVGRAQFFMGAMREFVGMPVSSVIDYKERIVGGGVNSAARRKGSNTIESSNDSEITDPDN